MGAQLAGKTLGIVGLGRIGQAVAKRAKALEMQVLGYDPFLSKDKAKQLGIEPVDTVDEMLPQVDYLTVHTPLTDETRNLIDRPQLDRAQAGRAADQRGPRRHLQRSGARRRAEERQARRRGARRVRRGAVHRQPAVRHAGRALHAAPGGEHRRSPDAGRRRSGAAADRFPDDRRRSGTR